MIYALGFLAQICFSARLLIQWIISEKEKQVVSPTLFWLLSLLGSYLLFFYGWLRNDFAIILGQLISYYIYLEFEHEKQLAKDSGTHPLHSPHNPDRSHRIYVSRGKRVHQSIFLQ